MIRRAEQLDFLVVARTGSGPWPHPVEVAVHPAGRDSRVSFSVGPHAVNSGGQFKIAHVLDHERTGINPVFDEEFTAAELDWLVPFLVRLGRGEDVREEIREAYVQRHGRRPEVLWQERYES